MRHPIRVLVALSLLGSLLAACVVLAPRVQPPSAVASPARCVAQGGAACRRACAAGDGSACTTLAIMLDVGLDAGVPADQAASLSARACELGHAGGCLLEAARGRGKPVAGTLSSLDAACTAGDLRACRSFGMLQLFGWLGVPQDSKAALRAFRRGCPGDAESCARAADRCRRDPGDCSDDERRQLERATDEALRTACENEPGPACSVLGHRLLNRPVAERDVERALTLMELGCSRGSCAFLRATSSGAPRGLPEQTLERARQSLVRLGQSPETCQLRREDLVRRCFVDERVGFVPPVCDELKEALARRPYDCGLPLGADLARVNGRAIDREQFQREYERVVAQLEIPHDLRPRFGIAKQLLAQWIDAELLAQAAEAAGTTLTPQELAAPRTESELHLAEGQIQRLRTALKFAGEQRTTLEATLQSLREAALIERNEVLLQSIELHDAP